MTRAAVRRTLLALLASVLITPALVAPAQAATARYDDPADATASLADIRQVTVRHTERRVYVSVRFTDLRPSTDAAGGAPGAAVYYDTDGATAGPERRLGTGLAEGTDYQLVTMSGWGQTSGEPSSCPVNVRLDYRRDVMSSWVARRCLGNPEAVRVAVHMVDPADPSHPVSDWLRGVRRWTQPVAVG